MAELAKDEESGVLFLPAQVLIKCMVYLFRQNISTPRSYLVLCGEVTPGHYTASDVCSSYVEECIAGGELHNAKRNMF